MGQTSRPAVSVCVDPTQPLATASPAHQSRIPIRSVLVGHLRRMSERWAALSPLQQCEYVRDRVGIAFQAGRILFGLQFNLQPDAVRIVEIEGLAILPFDNVGYGDPMVLEPLVGGVKFLKRVHRPQHSFTTRVLRKAEAATTRGRYARSWSSLPGSRLGGEGNRRVEQHRPRSLGALYKRAWEQTGRPTGSPRPCATAANGPTRCCRTRRPAGDRGG